jgi:2,4-didehydro-3-deoxy-L-rhamnonate hydrolase
VRLVRYRSGGEERPGILDQEGTVRDLSGLTDDLFAGALADVVATVSTANVAGLPLAEGVEGYGAPVAGSARLSALA